MKEVVLTLTMWTVTICTYISYVPQIIKLYKTKHAEDLSVTSWILWTVSALANTVYSFILARPELIFASVSETLLILTVLFQTMYYKKREEAKKMEEESEKIEEFFRKLKSTDDAMVFIGTGVGRGIHNKMVKGDCIDE